MRTIALLVIFGLTSLAAQGADETPCQAVARFEATRLAPNALQDDRLLIQAGRDVAVRFGVATIPCILDRSKARHPEEFLLYTPIVINLPLEEAITELGKHANGSDVRRAFWARELLIEMETYLVEQREKVTLLLSETEKAP